MPGQFIPAAKVAHSFEAMMALLTIIVWHLYGVHFNPETFPMDSSIFSGKISHERMMHEHPLEYRRWKQEHEGADAGEDDSEGPARGPARGPEGGADGLEEEVVPTAVLSET